MVLRAATAQPPSLEVKQRVIELAAVLTLSSRDSRWPRRGRSWFLAAAAATVAAACVMASRRQMAQEPTLIADLLPPVHSEGFQEGLLHRVFRVSGMALQSPGGDRGPARHRRVRTKARNLLRTDTPRSV
jgi:hypothetical protein